MRLLPKCLRSGFLLAAASLALAANALATWSIVVIDTRTGEVCIASATCLSDFNLRRGLAVVLVGKGVGAAQSSLDPGQNRIRMRDDMLLGMTPAQILADLAAHDSNHQSRQYGIVSVDGYPVSFTGNGAGNAKYGVVGRVGSLAYAIQGNVLTGNVVVTEAEAALLSAPGDLGQRVMAAMEAARALGGDGRCSCLSGPPPSCGAPPPGFIKSAHTAFVVLARLGDSDGTCNGADGCANGDYYLYRKAIGNSSDPDPVIELRRRFLEWRRNKEGKPDHLLSTVEAAAPRLVADGASTTEVQLRLVDLEGAPLTSGGQTLIIQDVSPGGVPVALAGAGLDHGDGTHSFRLTATTQPGLGRFRIVVRQGNLDVQLHPELEILVDPAAELHAGFSEVSAGLGADVPFVVQRAASAGQFCLLLASASGSQPGTPFGGGTLPLNTDRLLEWTLGNPGALFPGSQGSLDSGGRRLAELHANPVMLAPFIGGRFDFCAAIGSSNPLHFTNVTGFTILP